jgi:type IV pilus assembly protein PilO
MDKLKQYVIFAVLGCLVVLAAGWFLLVSPKRSDAAAIRTEADSQVAANAQLSTQLQVLKAQAKDLPKQQAKLAAVAAKIPSNPALPALVRALTSAATSAGVELVSMTPGAPALVAPVATAATAPTAGAATTPSTTSTTGGSSSSAGQLASIPLTLNVVGGYFQAEQFVAALENLPRSMRVTGLTVAPGANPVKPNAAPASLDDGKSLLTVVTGQVFMAANRPAATAVTVPGQAVTGTGVVPVAPVTTVKK